MGKIRNFFNWLEYNNRNTRKVEIMNMFFEYANCKRFGIEYPNMEEMNFCKEWIRHERFNRPEDAEFITKLAKEILGEDWKPLLWGTENAISE